MTRRALFARLYAAMSPARRRQFILLLVATTVCAAAEAFAIGAALPFLALLADPAGAALPVEVRERLASVGPPIASAALLLAGATLLLVVLRLTLLWRQQKFAMGYGRELAGLVFGRMLRQPYLAYLSRNSSEMLAGMEKVERLVGTLIYPAIQGFVAAVLALFVMTALLLVDAVAASIAAVATAAAYAAVSLLVRRRLEANSRVVSASITARARTVREALGGIRDILLDGSQALHQAKYDAFEVRNRRAQAENVFLGQAPRYAVEAVAVIVMAGVALLVSRGAGGIAEAIPVLGALALGAQRLLPLLQQVWAGYSQVSAQHQSLHDVAMLMELPIEREDGPRPAPLPLRQEIRFDRLSFAYRPDRPVVRDLDCTIEAGEWVGLAGPTGSGKSTFVDLLMGLIEPDGGRILIDGQPLTRELRRAWQANIAHVPQFIYLADDSIAANVTLGQDADAVDRARLDQAVRAAQLDSFVESLPDGLDSRVGERGVQLSGGQRQRIGLARALYKQAGVLVLDEATNALDEATETAVLAAIRALYGQVTVIMVAHRPSVLARCDRVISLEPVQEPAAALRA
ncbi:ABC transporter ATP-binding protein [Sphingosinicella sp. YJ22]|uniref:ABC transporter ATP-binding protein n=1 Tax=Sphingosinicella sp. YJ22 TaxID=1104780 RepID=UPI00140AE58A|nr:ABC transporter ATP-binding protein [Sphingosinicella sp. YJ22]